MLDGVSGLRNSFAMDTREFCEADWNFKALPAEQSLAACYYEFARESPSLLSVYSDLTPRPNVSRPLHSRKTARLVEAVQEQAFMLHRILTVFKLGAPWQTLDENARISVSEELARLQKAKADGNPFFVVNRCREVPWEGHTKQEMPFRPVGLDSELGIERTLVEIDWRHFSDGQISVAFSKWIADARPPSIPEPLERGHKPVDHRAKLDRLGIRRLRSRLTFVEAKAQLRRMGSGYKFSDSSECNREANKVDADLHELFPFLRKSEVVLCGPLRK